MSEEDPLGIVGQTVAEKYRIERAVGQGGFSCVYCAEHTIWHRPVAVKFFHFLSSVSVEYRDQFQQAFIQEGALLTQLSSQTAGIVQARDIGTYTTPDGHWLPYMVLEWLEGATLDELMERERAAGKPPWRLEEMTVFLGQAAHALDVAHAHGVVHCDIKPANLFVIGQGAREGLASLKILDFGVAKRMLDERLRAALVRVGTDVTSFTPQYGAPEQFNRQNERTGPWTDVFALALVALEMLLGRPALGGEDPAELGVNAGDPERRPTPRRLGLDVSDEVEAVFAKALAVDPGERYARASEFWNALEVGVFGIALASRPGGSAPVLASSPASLPLAASGGPSSRAPAVVTASPSRRSAWLRALTAAALVLVGAAGAALTWFVKQPASPASVPLPSASTAASAEPLPPLRPTCPESMVYIGAGQYFRGSDARDAMDNEKPAHQVILDAFCIDRFEVTAQKYKACSDVGKCKRAAASVDWEGITAPQRRVYSPLCTGDDPDKRDHPINCVSWEMAEIYCVAQDERLPTEAEWEYATRSPDGRVYPWGDEPPTARHLNACGSECVAWGRRHGERLVALYPDDDGFPTTAPVGKFPAGNSAFGLSDVVGNVWEWVADYYGPYSHEELKNPRGPAQGERRVVRGGAWNGSYASWLRPSFRYSMDPKSLSHGVGFRCAATPVMKPETPAPPVSATKP